MLRNGKPVGVFRDLNEGTYKLGRSGDVVLRKGFSLWDTIVSSLAYTKVYDFKSDVIGYVNSELANMINGNGTTIHLKQDGIIKKSLFLTPPRRG